MYIYSYYACVLLLKAIEQRRVYVRFTTKGALGDNGSLDVDEDDVEDWPFLYSLQYPC